MCTFSSDHHPTFCRYPDGKYYSYRQPSSLRTLLRAILILVIFPWYYQVIKTSCDVTWFWLFWFTLFCLLSLSMPTSVTLQHYHRMCFLCGGSARRPYLGKWQYYHPAISLWPGRLSERRIVGTAWIYTGEMFEMSSAHQPVIDAIAWPECNAFWKRVFVHRSLLTFGCI